MISSRLMHCATLALSLLGAGSTIASDWPQWRGPDRTGHVPPGVAVPAKLPAEAKVLWKIKVGDGFAAPIVANGKVFFYDNVGTMETLHAVEAATGKELWQVAIDESFKDTQGPAGPRCTPLADGDRVYAQSHKGVLQCLNAKDGRKLWRVDYVNDFGTIFIGEKGQAQGAARHGNTGAPVIDGDQIIALVGSTNGAGVVSFNKLTGKIIWKSQNDIAAYAAPIVTTILGVKQVVAFTAEGLIGLDAKTGKLLWRVPFKTNFSRHVTTPMVVDDIVVIASNEFGMVGTKISKDGSNFKAETIWTTKEAAMNFSSPVAVGEHLYGLGPKKVMICVNVKTGKVTWTKEGYFLAEPGKSVGYFTVMGKNILALTDGGLLALFTADPAAFHEVSQVQVCAQTWSAPAYADGRLYVRDGVKAGGVLQCIELLP